MSDITKFTEYNVAVPDWFITKIQDALNERDVAGLIANTRTGIKVTAEHPLVTATGIALGSSATAAREQIGGLFPCISVVELDESESETKTGGFGQSPSMSIDGDMINTIREIDTKTRREDGLISDDQISSIETALTDADAAITGEVHRYWIDDGVMISLWDEVLERRQILGRLLRSILYDLLLDMKTANLLKVSIRTSRGLVNFDFGRVLYGQETQILFQNSFKNIRVTSDSYDWPETVHVRGRYRSEDEDEGNEFENHADEE